ncbi:hypothetical protein L2E82_42981 [Cichorium intybus]|uniref:Uncharacterized protein n=1 Tax=Cichorium intybus TaxID=13427 RepID=A0ACB8ZN87_CICIN|nr:hypothetical protein L2E82_42981 [Cichorium intybus]
MKRGKSFNATLVGKGEAISNTFMRSFNNLLMFIIVWLNGLKVFFLEQKLIKCKLILHALCSHYQQSNMEQPTAEKIMRS